MSDQSYSQNKSEEQVQLSEGTNPSTSSDDGSRSTPRNLPKAATRTRKKKTSDLEDEDYVAVEDEATSRKKMLKKEYDTVASVGFRSNFKKNPTHTQDHVMHSNERRECCLRTHADRLRKH